LNDRVADNLDKFDITESESLLFGTNFGVVTDIHTGPDGKVYLVSLSNGAVYSIGGPKPSRNHNGDNNDDDDDDQGENNNRGSRYSHRHD
jgi:hypothetical protein